MVSDEFLKKCVNENPNKLSDSELKSCINTIIYNPEAQKKLGATDREQLNIVILRDKANKLDFLEGYTKWKSIGSWREISPEGEVIKEFPEEKNMSIEVEFKDRPDERIGKRLLELLSEVNRRWIKEKLLYAFTEPIEESTL